MRHSDAYYPPPDPNGKAVVPAGAFDRGYRDVMTRPSEQDDMVSTGLVDYWRMLVRRKWMILLFTLAGVLGGFVITIPSALVFDARTLIEVVDINENFMGMAKVDPEVGNYSWRNISTELYILTSGGLKWKVLERLNRELTPTPPPDLPGALAALRRRARQLAHRDPADPVRALSVALRGASNSLDLKVIPETRLIEIRCSSTLPEVSAAFANAMASEYIDQNMERRVKGLQRSSQWFTTQLQEMKEKLEQSQQRLNAVRHAENATTQASPQSLTATRLASLQQQVGSTQAERIAKEAQLQTIAAAKDSDLLDTTVLGPFKSKLEEARRKLSLLNATLTPAHYKVKQAELEVADADAALKREREALVSRLRIDLDSIKERERMLTAAYNSQLRNVSTSGNELNASVLQQEVENNRQQYQALLQQASQAAVASAVPANNIRVIEPARPANQPSNLFEATALALGGVSGLLLSVAIAVVLHYLNRSVQGPGHATAALGTRELGVVLSGNSRVVQANRKNRTTALLPPAGNFLKAEEHPILAESFRGILASILLPYRSHVPQVIVVSSPEMKEGKSTVASNLGLALASLHRRVLLIDADLRRPQLHKNFEISNKAGLTSLLTGEADEFVLEDAVLETGKKNLSVLPAGPPPENPAALLYSPRLDRLIRRLRANYDHIIIDTPPMLQFPDARLTATLCDGVVLVLRSGVTGLENAVASRDLLTQDGTRLIGTILNDWAPKKHEIAQYKKYQTYYTPQEDQ